MFKDKYSNLPDEPVMKYNEMDTPSSSAGPRNNGLSSSSSSTRKRKRHSSKHNSSAGGGHTSSLVTSSDDNASSDESSDDPDTSPDNTLRQLRSLQEQVEFLRSRNTTDTLLDLAGEDHRRHALVSRPTNERSHHPTLQAANQTQ